MVSAETSALFSTGAKDYQNAKNQTDTYTVNANGTDGDIIVVMVTGNTNWQSKANILRINNKTVFWGNGAKSNPGYSLGDDATVYNTWSGRTFTFTIDPITGDTSIVDSKGNKATTNVGVIGETFEIGVGQDWANSWKLTSITVTQEVGEVPGGDEPEPEEPTIPTDLFSTGTKDYTGWSDNSFDTYTVNTNGTACDITVTFAYVRTNWQRKANILTINGKTVFFGNGEQNNPAYSLGDDSTVYSGWTTDRVITVVINPLTGDATVTDNESHSATTNVGVIGDSFDIVVGQAQTNSWSLTSLEVIQEAPECTMWVGGRQTSAVDAEGKYSVRFVGVLSGLPAGSEKVGFEIKAPAFGKEWDLSTNTVYYSLKANFGAETITAEDCKGKYITAAAITGIPADVGAIEFVVTPYVVFMIDGVETKIYGEAVTVPDVLPSVAE